MLDAQKVKKQGCFPQSGVTFTWFNSKVPQIHHGGSGRTVCMSKEVSLDSCPPWGCRPSQRKYLSVFCFEEVVSISHQVSADFTVPIRELPSFLISKCGKWSMCGHKDLFTTDIYLKCFQRYIFTEVGENLSSHVLLRAVRTSYLWESGLRSPGCPVSAPGVLLATSAFLSLSVPPFHRVHEEVMIRPVSLGRLQG